MSELITEGFARRVNGIALVRCIVELDGWLSHCQMVKSLPYMDDQILAGMMSMRFTPAMYQGHPQRVKMVVPLRLHAPPPTPAE